MDDNTEPMISGMYPRLVVSDAAGAIEFYRRAFGATEVDRYTEPGGKIVHAELRIGHIVLALKDESNGDPAPSSIGGSPVIMALQVTDADAVGTAMTAAGATVVYPIQDQPYGSRGGRLADPYGHLWMIDQELEQLSHEEMQRRTDAMFGG